MIDKKAEIGIILLACSVFAWFFNVTVVGGPLWEMLSLLGIRSSFSHLAIMYVPVSVLIIVGLAFYVAGKRELKKRSIKHQDILALSTFLGAVLLFLGVLFSVLGWLINVRGYAYKLDRALIGTFIESSPPLLSFALWAISGIILVADRWRNLKVSNQKRN